MDVDLLNRAFFYAKLKVNRADRHINEAQHWFRLYVESDFCRIVDERNTETREQSIRVEASGVPVNLVLAIGDAFHCMSAALDYVMSGMMAAKTGSSTRIGFPTDESRQSLRKSFMAPREGKKTPPNRRIVEAFPLVALKLLTVIKPYNGGDFGLWEVRKADNIDKHNLIVPSVTITELRDVVLVDEVYNNVFSPEILSVGAGGVLNAISYGNGGSYFVVKNKGQASAYITFPHDSKVYAGKPVFPTLLEASQLIAKAIDIIELTARRYV